jgi:hypothetical protein
MIRLIIVDIVGKSILFNIFVHILFMFFIVIFDFCFFLIYLCSLMCKRGSVEL